MKDHTNSVKGGGRSFKGVAMLLFSLGAGAAGVYLSQQYIEGQVAARTQVEPEAVAMAKVVVPMRSLKRGEVVRRDDLVNREIPADYVDSNTVTQENVAMAIGQRLDFDIDGGRPLLWAHLAGGMTPTFSGNVAPGLRAMTVRVDDVNSISGFLQPGDHVDLLMSYGSEEKQRILPVMQQLEVIATGVQTEADKAGNGQQRSFSNVTVHVTPADAQKLTLAQQVGKLTAILRNPEDDGELGDHTLALPELLSLGKAPVAKPVRRKAKVVAAPSIQYIIGGQ